MTGRVSLRGSVLTVALVAAVACAPGQRSHSGIPPSIAPVYDQATGRLTELRYDANHNGRTDTVSYMNGPRVVRVEIDQDEDGVVDRWEHYDGEGHLVRVGFSRTGDGHENAWSYADAAGRITRIDMAGADGRISRSEHYEAATIVAAEEDSDRDGVVDRWEAYDHGRLVRLSFATGQGDRTSRPTQTLIYAVDGSVRTESSQEH